MPRSGKGPKGPKSIHDYPAEIREAVLANRSSYRDQLLLELSERLDSYGEELSRSDPAHKARLSKRKDAVWSLIREAARAWAERAAPPDEVELALGRTDEQAEVTARPEPMLRDMTNVHVLRWRKPGGK